MTSDVGMCTMSDVGMRTMSDVGMKTGKCGGLGGNGETRVSYPTQSSSGCLFNLSRLHLPSRVSH